MNHFLGYLLETIIGKIFNLHDILLIWVIIIIINHKTFLKS